MSYVHAFSFFSTWFELHYERGPGIHNDFFQDLNTLMLNSCVILLMVLEGLNDVPYALFSKIGGNISMVLD